jgi:hypothetical protein
MERPKLSPEEIKKVRQAMPNNMASAYARGCVAHDEAALRMRRFDVAVPWKAPVGLL